MSRCSACNRRRTAKYLAPATRDGIVLFGEGPHQVRAGDLLCVAHIVTDPPVPASAGALEEAVGRFANLYGWRGSRGAGPSRAA